MNLKSLSALGAGLLLAACSQAPRTDSLTQYVDMRIGTGGHGHVFMGANVPFGAVQLGPTSIPQSWDWTSGYHISDTTVIGFSHTHLNGTGIGDLFDVTVMPVVGQVTYARGTEDDPQSGMWSYFSHANEKARPGYYATRLDRYGIDVELTATKRVGLHKYTFPASADAAVVFDLENGGCWDAPTETFIERADDHTISGYRYSTGWAKDQRVYFTAEFSKPFKSLAIYEGGEGGGLREGDSFRAERLYGRVGFDTSAGETIYVKVAISPVSIENARLNMQSELPGWDFEATAAAADRAWDAELQKVRIETSDDAARRIFYTALYHAFLLPRSISENGRYRSPYNGQVCEGESFTDYSTWDTFRALHPLLVLLKPDLASHMVTGLLNGYDEGGWMPKWPNPGYTNCMMGTHSDAIIADAYVKGVRGFDEQKAAEAMLKNANVKGNHIAWGRLGIEDYNSLGYVPVDHYRESVARTMEFAYDDWCLARFFEAKGDTEKAREYDLRSQRFKNVLDAETKLVRARRSDGTWAAPSDYNISVWSGFNETGALNYRKNYTLFAPHDVPALIEFMGGNDAMAAFLDDIFDNGIYYVGDEFSMHAPYMYNLCGMPWKTQRRVYDIVNTYYLPQPSGLPGNDDCGQLSAWYLFSAMGFYPMCPGSTEYQLGIPCLPEIILHLPNGRDFRIVCENFGSGNCYVQSVTLNGKALERPAIDHADILRGGELRFSVADTPSKTCFTSKSR